MGSGASIGALVGNGVFFASEGCELDLLGEIVGEFVSGSGRVCFPPPPLCVQYENSGFTKSLQQ